MTIQDLKSTAVSSPLADRMRPRNFEEFFGQKEIVGEGKLLRRLVEADELSSLIFWGPPGSGKTTLAHIIAEQTKSKFVMLSAVMSGKDDLKKVVEGAASPPEGSIAPQSPLERGGRGVSAVVRPKTILFIDEIHRWNKAQQDALLPFVEKGIIILIGATTENPSFEIIGALLSRSRVFILRPLLEEDIIKIIERALADKARGLGNLEINIAPETVEFLAGLSGGDARVALNGLELAVKVKFPFEKALVQNPPLEGGRGVLVVAKDDIKEALQRTHLVFDKKGGEFYNLISALHKSMRGHDANAALYWLARMLEGGADPLYVARRVLRFASEDIGMANSEALVQANAAYDACHKIGLPECTVHLAQAVVYCAKSAKSNLLYTAYGQAAEDARATSHLGAPLHLRNAPTRFMKDIGYGQGYKYNPDFAGPVKQDYLPEELKGRNYLKK